MPASISARQLVEDVWNGGSSGLELGPILSTVASRDLDHLASELASAAPRECTCTFSSEIKNGIREQAYSFHNRAGTLTNAIQQNIVKLFDIHAIRVAHTPDLLPYYSVALLPLVANELARLVSQHLGCQIAEVYISIDTDLSADRRIRTAIIPDLFRRDGELPLTTAIPRADRRRIIATQRSPVMSDVHLWRQLYANNLRTHLDFLRVPSRSNAFDLLLGNAEQIFDDMSFAATAATNLADFSNIVFSRLLNLRMGLPTVFLSQLDVCRLLASNFLGLQNEATRWLAMSARAARDFRDRGVEVGPVGAGQAFWSVCPNCGRRTLRQENGLDQASRCCGGTSECILVPRIWVDNILDAALMGFIAGVSYIGSSNHVAVSAEVLSRLRLTHYHELLFAALGSIWGPPEVAAQSWQHLRRGSQSFAISAPRVLTRGFSGRSSFIYPMSCYGVGQIVDGWREHLFLSGVGAPYAHSPTWMINR